MHWWGSKRERAPSGDRQRVHRRDACESGGLAPWQVFAYLLAEVLSSFAIHSHVQPSALNANMECLAFDVRTSLSASFPDACFPSSPPFLHAVLRKASVLDRTAFHQYLSAFTPFAFAHTGRELL